MIATAIIYTFFFLSTILVDSVDRSKFRTCQDTGFCKKWRGSGDIKKTFNIQYEIVDDALLPASVRTEAAVASSAKWIAAVDGIDRVDKGSVSLILSVTFLLSGAIRCKLSEVGLPRWQPTDLLQAEGLQLGSYRELKPSTNSADAQLLPSSFRTSPLDWAKVVALLATTASSEQSTVLIVHKSPVRLELFHGDLLQAVVNERSLLHWEHSAKSASSREVKTDSSKEEYDKHQGKVVVDYGEDGLAIYEDGSREERKEEANEVFASQEADANDRGDSFGGHVDSRPHGPMSVGVDVSFPYAKNVYGLPEHTVSLSLPNTRVGSGSQPGSRSHFSEPYRLYSLDVFEYELDQPMALYGSIPLLLAHAVLQGQGEPKGITTGVFYFNPSETFVDISEGGTPQNSFRESHWISESGEVDLFLLPGPTPADIYKQYTKLTGTQQLPPLFALGYHQCRWNYRDEKDVAAVEAMFEQLDYPYDVLWLDIEHTDGKRYFTWDKSLFPNPIEMQQNLSAHGRKMVTIVDPHIKRDENWELHKEATAKGLYIKKSDGKSDFDGWCWPGSSSYLDFTCEQVRLWWAEQFRLDKYKGSTMDLFTWNDMNEPSVFNGPEVSMPKDARNRKGVEHREWHNLFGIYMQMATALGLTLRSTADSEHAQERPFVLTRSFWAGSQKYGAMWTGDNAAQWGHLQIAAPMLLSINLGGLSFAGADVGGFFGEPDAELFTRWYQAGAFTPFFRGHAHHDTKRREPWVFGDPYTSVLRSVALLRYSLLPFWYTVFFEAHSGGLPVMRPLFLEFPNDPDPNLLTIDDQWMVGSVLMVKPVTAAGQNEVSVYFPGGADGWYALDSMRLAGGAREKALVVSAPLEKIPVFVRAGKILPRKMRLRRSSKLMFFDPFTLEVYPKTIGDVSQSAQGYLYLDDEHTLSHESGVFSLRLLSFSSGNAGVSVLRCTTAQSFAQADAIAAATDKDVYSAPNTVERVVIAGQVKSPKAIKIVTAGNEELSLEFFYDSSSETITVKKPNVKISDDWDLKILFDSIL